MRIAAILGCLLLSGCPSKKVPDQQAEAMFKQLSGQVAAAPLEVEYTKRLSETETIRGLRIPYSGNLFTGAADDVRCMLYVNDTYRTTQIVCPDSSERHPRDEIRETGTVDPIN